jgi:hypothetical protein
MFGIFDAKGANIGRVIAHATPDEPRCGSQFVAPELAQG